MRKKNTKHSKALSISHNLVFSHACSLGRATLSPHPGLCSCLWIYARHNAVLRILVQIYGLGVLNCCSKVSLRIAYVVFLFDVVCEGYGLLEIDIDVYVHWVPSTTSKKMQKKLLVISELFNIAVNYFDAKTSARVDGCFVYVVSNVLKIFIFIQFIYSRVIVYILRVLNLVDLFKNVLKKECCHFLCAMSFISSALIIFFVLIDVNECLVHMVLVILFYGKFTYFKRVFLQLYSIQVFPQCNGFCFDLCQFQMYRVPTGTGKPGKMRQLFPVREF